MSEGRHGRFAALMVVVLAVFTTMPLLQPYFFASSDGLFHLYRLMEYHTVLNDGVLYPRWAPDFFFGMGMPLFNFYAPLTYYWGEIYHLLGAGFIDSMRLLAATAMVLSGLGAYLYARTVLSPPSAMLAAVAYEYVPYHLVNLYYRGDLPEYVAYTWYPFILWAIKRLVATRRARYLAAGSLFYAALILTHNLSAFIFSGFLVIYAVAALWHPPAARRPMAGTAVEGDPPVADAAVDDGIALGRQDDAGTAAGPAQERSPIRGYVRGAVGRLAIMVGVAWGMTAFFWLPALAERSSLTLERLLLHYNFREHFPTLDQLLSSEFLHRYGVVFRSSEVYGYKLGFLQAVFLVLGLVILIWRYRRLRRALRVEAIAALLVAALAFFFIFPSSLWLWDNVPLLSLTQFPWRFLAFVALPGAILAGLVVESVRQRLRWALAGVLAALVIVSSVARLAPIMSNVKEADISPLGSLEFELTYGAIGTSAASEYLPPWVPELPATSPGAFAAVTGRPASTPVRPGVSATVVERRAAGATYRVRAEQAGNFVPDILYFPGWIAVVDGKPSNAAIDEATGLIKVAVPQGDHTVALRFAETPLRRASEVASGLVLFGLLSWLALSSRRQFRLPRLAWRLPGLATDRSALAKAGLAVAVLVAWIFVQSGYDAGLGLAGGRWLPLLVNMDDQVLIQGYDLAGVEPTPTSSVRVPPGAQFTVGIAWRLLGDPTKRYRPFVRLTNSHGQTWAYAQSPVELPAQGGDSRGLQTTAMPIAVPPATPPGVYQIEVGFLPEGSNLPLEARSVRVVPMLPGEKGARLGTVIVGDPAAPELRPGQVVESVNFGDALRLLDISLTDGEALKSGRPGGPLARDEVGAWQVPAGHVVHLDLLWQGTGQRRDDLTVTARLASEGNLLWAVRDSRPADGRYPTSYWSNGETVRDQLNLGIPPETPPGRYELQLEVVSRSGPLSIFDPNHTPIGPTLRVGALTVLPAAQPFAAKSVKMQRNVATALHDGFELLGYSLGRPELQPGEQLRVDLLWRAAKITSRDFGLRVEVLDSSGKAWASRSLKMGGEAYPTSAWRAGEAIRQQLDLALQAAAPPGEGRVAITLLDISSGEPFDNLNIGALRILPRDRSFSAAPSRQLERVLDGKIRLLGFDLATAAGKLDGAAELPAGQSLRVTLFWQGMAAMNTNYTVFAQLLNSAGRLVAQHDSPPRNGAAPTMGWVKDEVVADQHDIPVPADLPTGDYTLIAGAYDTLTGKRLAVQGEGDAISLAPIKMVAPR